MPIKFSLAFAKFLYCKTFCYDNGKIFTHLGDYLTFERGQQALHTQSDNILPEDRLEGLLMAMADFHVQINLLKMIYKMLFKVVILR